MTPLSRARAALHCRSAARNRSVSAAGVLAYLALTLWLLPGREPRASIHYVVVLTLGYGHLIGSASFSARSALARRRAQAVPAGAIGPPPGGGGGSLAARLALWLVSIAVALALYGRALELQPTLVAPLLLAFATWHTVENDLALAALYRSGHHSAPLARGRAGALAAIGVSTLILALSAATLHREAQGRSGWIGFGDLFAASSLYHLLSWLVVCLDRRAADPELRADDAHLLLVHALPVAVCLGLFALPGQSVAALWLAAFSPSLYLFWASLHVVQTLLVRHRRDARAQRPGSRGSGAGRAERAGSAGHQDQRGPRLPPARSA